MEVKNPLFKEDFGISTNSLINLSEEKLPSYCLSAQTEYGVAHSTIEKLNNS